MMKKTLLIFISLLFSISFLSADIVTHKCEHPYKTEQSTYNKSVSEFKKCIDAYIETYKDNINYKDEIYVAKMEWNDLVNETKGYDTYQDNPKPIDNSQAYRYDGMTCLELVDERKKLIRKQKEIKALASQITQRVLAGILVAAIPTSGLTDYTQELEDIKTNIGHVNKKLTTCK